VGKNIGVSPANARFLGSRGGSENGTALEGIRYGP